MFLSLLRMTSRAPPQDTRKGYPYHGRRYFSTDTCDSTFSHGLFLRSVLLIVSVVSLVAVVSDVSLVGWWQSSSELPPGMTIHIYISARLRFSWGLQEVGGLRLGCHLVITFGFGKVEPDGAPLIQRVPTDIFTLLLCYWRPAAKVIDQCPVGHVTSRE